MSLCTHASTYPSILPWRWGHSFQYLVWTQTPASYATVWLQLPSRRTQPGRSSAWVQRPLHRVQELQLRVCWWWRWRTAPAEQSRDSATASHGQHSWVSWVVHVGCSEMIGIAPMYYHVCLCTDYNPFSQTAICKFKMYCMAIMIHRLLKIIIIIIRNYIDACRLMFVCGSIWVHSWINNLSTVHVATAVWNLVYTECCKIWNVVALYIHTWN